MSLLLCASFENLTVDIGVSSHNAFAFYLD